MTVWTIVVAGGSGTRFGTLKQFELLGDRRVVDVAADTARAASDGVVVVVPAPYAGGDTVAGGATRSDSVRAGLTAVPSDATIVCVHDAARPLASIELFGAVVDAVRGGVDGAVPACPVADTIKVVDADGTIVATPDRATLVAVQTPQAFGADVLRRAHGSGRDSTDDAALVENLGGRVVTVPGEPWNLKITTQDDLEWARVWLSRAPA